MKTFKLVKVILGAAFSCFLLGSNQQALGQDGTWETKAPMPEGRIQSAGATVGGLFYVFGGSDGNGASTIPEVYDPVANTWSFRAADSIARSMMSAEVINNKVYVVGGWVGSDSSSPTSALTFYDPATDSWTNATPMSNARGGTASGVINGKLYVTGGMGRGTWYSQTAIYDPLSNSWTSGAPLPLPVYAAGAVVINGKLYVLGGILVNHSGHTPALQIYDPASNSWTTGASMPTSRYSSKAAALNGKLYAVAGGNNSGALSTVEIYDPVSNTWTLGTPEPSARNLGVSCVINSKLYVAGGYNASGMIGATLDVFTPPPGLSLQMYAGLTIMAPVGSTNQIQYVNDVSNTNWITLTNLVLPSNPYIFIDYGSPGQPRRFYRDVLSP